MLKFRLLATAVALAGSALVAGAAPANASPASGPAGAAGSAKPATALIGEFHQIQSGVNTNLCLEPQASPATRIVIAACNGSLAQGWLALNDGNNRYRFVNGSGRGCMSVNNVPFNGAVVQLDNCTLSDGSGRSVSNATWLSSRALPDFVTLRTRVGNRDNNFCLDDPFQSQTPGQAVQLFGCNNSIAQRWLVGSN